MSGEEERNRSLENAYQILVQLLQRDGQRLDQHELLLAQHEARMNDFDAMMKSMAEEFNALMRVIAEAQANADFKIAALADAQIRTEAALERVEAQQAHTDRRLSALIDIVRGMHEGGPPPQSES